MDTDLVDLDATAQAEMVHRNELKPVDLVDAAIRRIERADAPINSVVIPLFERARSDAEKLTVGDGTPFPGVPAVVKDSVPTAGDPWHRGMELLRRIDHRAPHDAHVVSRMRTAGLAIVGKANVGELEGGITCEPASYGATRNPWDLSLSVGGSSGGPAAAVAARLVPLGLGVDGGGSVRIPASICGIVGFKPSRGRLSLHPMYIEDGASTAGVLSRTIRDAASALDALAGRPHGDHFAAPDLPRPLAQEVDADPGRLRIGVWNGAADGVTAHADCVAAAADTAALLESLGHDVSPSHPKEIDSGFFHTPEFVVVAASHIAHQLHDIEDELGRSISADDVEAVTWAAVQATQQSTAEMLHSGIARNRAAAVRYASWWDEGFDLLLTPTIAVPPFPIGALTPTSPDQPWPDVVSWVPFTAHANLAGLPAVSLPMYQNGDGLPIGVQLIARYGREDLLVRAASQLERARPWDHRPPFAC